MSKQITRNIVATTEDFITDYAILHGFDNRVESLTVTQLIELSFDIESDYEFAFQVLADEPEVLLASQALSLIYTLIESKRCYLFDDSLSDELPF